MEEGVEEFFIVQFRQLLVDVCCAELREGTLEVI